MSNDSQNIRVRFAPSPTGFLHVGGARTALFNWLFARKHGGKFLLRIEDTDVARSGQEMVEAIIEGMQWLGLDWDEEPVRQSNRFDVYRNQAEQLVGQGKAYRCFCAHERLQELRQKTTREKTGAYKYDRHCLNLTETERDEKKNEGLAYVVRLKVPEGQTHFHDEVFGDITVEHEQLDDFIILRPEGVPTYHLAVVVDDHEMQISHVIRGDDHMSNTPKHLLLYEAFGWQPPVFAHVPLILGPDKQRLSKRHGATSIGEYQKAGYLSDAVLNFLSLLGWSAGGDRELFSREELVKEFDLSGISKKSSVFDETKLEWMNGQYLNEMDSEALLELVLPGLIGENLITGNYSNENRAYLIAIVDQIKSRTRRLTEFPERTRYFFQDPESYDEKGKRKHWKHPDQISRFETLIERIEGLAEFNTATLEPVMRGLAEEWDLSAGKLIHPVRLALTGATFSPGIFEVMELLGRETVIRRLQTAIDYLKQNPVNTVAGVME